MAVGDEIPEALGAQFCEPDDLPETTGIVEELAEHARVPRPTLWLWDVEEPNAMATGDSPETASVTVTSGLLDALDGKELRAVLAHEMGHIVNGDVAQATALARRGALEVGMTGAGATVAGIGAAMSEGLADDLLAGVGGVLVTGLVARRAETRLGEFSRGRELAADAYAAQAGGSARALATALARIEELAGRRRRAVPPWARLLVTVDPDPAATHPPTAERLAALGAAARLERRSRTCARCRFGEDERAMRCRRCGSDLPQLACRSCPGWLDVEDRLCPGCGVPAPTFACRRCGRALDLGTGTCPGCGQPQAPGFPAVPVASVLTPSRAARGRSFTLTRAAQRQLHHALREYLRPDETVEERTDARYRGVWGSVAGVLVVTTAQLLFVRRGFIHDRIEWGIPRHELVSAEAGPGAGSGVLRLTTAEGTGVELDGVYPPGLAEALVYRLAGS